MSAERFITVQFCDDIRHELFNKISLIGCYIASIQIDPLPAVLPKLCALIKVYTPMEHTARLLTVRLLRDDVPIAELSYATQQSDQDNVTPPDGARWKLATGAIVLSPFPIEAPCKLQVHAEWDDGVATSGCTWVESAQFAAARASKPAPAAVPQ